MKTRSGLWRRNANSKFNDSGHSAIVTHAPVALLRVTHALVVATGRNSAWVAIDGQNAPVVADMRRTRGARIMPVPGDRVAVTTHEAGRVVIDAIEARTFTLERESLDGRKKVMAANVDLLVAVVALANPSPRLVTLDQLLAFAHMRSLQAMVVFTKPDLVDEAEQAQLLSLYRHLGYTAMVCDAKHGVGIEPFRDALVGRQALMAGMSGVGKSSLFLRLGGDGPVGDVSRFGMGRQTTTTARLARIGEGFLIDSPGVNEFGLGRIDAGTLSQGFVEFDDLVTKCRFTDCSHTVEPGCAIRSAVEIGTIFPSRYESFRRILSGDAEIIDAGEPD